MLVWAFSAEGVCGGGQLYCIDDGVFCYVGLLVLKVCLVADSCTDVTTGVVLGGAFSAEGACGGGQLY